MKRIYALTITLMILSSHAMAQGDPQEYGDAPEGVIAYPSNGITGSFPTCLGGPGGVIIHNNFGAFFTSFDLENDGNAGLCPGFSPYDSDECYADGDAGLIIPEPYTIFSGQVVTCPVSNGTALGQPCQPVSWGPDIDIKTANFMPGGTTGYVNVLIDWNQDGTWGGSLICPPEVTVPEHVLVNFQVPNGFSGLLSELAPPSFSTGPFKGFFWTRFTISETPVPDDWDGSGAFEDGETEDYLIYAGDYDFGDAPEGSVAYPATGVTGTFPTCSSSGSSPYVKHITGDIYFGPSSEGEATGNAGHCPAFSPDLYDQDECYQDGDAGLIWPEPYTIAGPSGGETVVPCSGSGAIIDTACQIVFWGSQIDIEVTGPGYVNMLMDWNQDGHWALDPESTCPVGGLVPEHVLVDFPVGAVSNVPLSTLSPPPFRLGPANGFTWCRFTISDQPVGDNNWNGAGNFMNGETEDYLLEVYTSGVIIRETNPPKAGMPVRVIPNPASDRVTVEFTTGESHMVKVDILGIHGNTKGLIYEGRLDQGIHKLDYSLFTVDGTIPAGVYVVRIFLDGDLKGLNRLIIQP